MTERGHATRLHIIIETNAGLEAVHDIARASNRIDALFFGGVDMAAELSDAATPTSCSTRAPASFMPPPARVST